MKFALAQIDSQVGDRAGNLATARRFAQAAQRAACDVLVLPEIFDMGYDLARVAADSPRTEPPPIPELQEIARAHGLHVIAGVADTHDGAVYNAIALVDPDGGVTAKYYKTHLVTAAPMHEERFLRAGDEFVVAKVGDLMCGVMTCYDLRFPEVARVMTVRGAQVIVLASAWPMVRLPHWEILVRARAIENQVYMLACNRIGEDGPGLLFCGTSMAIDPYGTTIGAASAVDEELVLADVRPERVDAVRGKIKALRDRRPELYSDVVTLTLRKQHPS